MPDDTRHSQPADLDEVRRLMQAAGKRRRRWPVYLASLLVAVGFGLLAARSLADLPVFGIPLDKFGGLLVVAGLLLFCTWIAWRLLTSLVLVVRNYRIFPKIFTLKRDLERLQAASKEIEREASRLEDLSRESGARDKKS